MLYLLLSYLPVIICGIHVVRTGREYYWLWLLFIGGPIGVAIYFFAILLPELLGGRLGGRLRGGRGLWRRLLLWVDPQREYRQATAAVEESPTVGNRMKLAEAATELGRWDEAEKILGDCAVGHWANDPVILYEHALALVELGRWTEALARVDALKKSGAKGDSPQVSLVAARAYAGLAQTSEAEAAFRSAMDRFAGLEAVGRYVAWLAQTGRKEEAEAAMADLNRRYKKVPGPMKGEARIWLGLAADATKASAKPEKAKK